MRFSPPLGTADGYSDDMASLQMASPYKDPRTRILYLRRQIPEALRGAFGGASLHKQSLRTRDMAEARIAFASANAELEARFEAERERIAREGARPSPEARAAALVRRYYEGFATPGGIDGRDRLRLTLVQLDRFADRATSSGMTLEWEIELPPPVAAEEWIALEASAEDFARFLQSPWYCEPERIGLLWARLRWDGADDTAWRAAVRLVVERIVRFADDEDDIGSIPRDAIAAEVATRIDVAVPRGFQLTPQRAVPRRANVRLRPDLGLIALFEAWQAAKSPTPQTALEYRRAVEDLIDFTADLKVIDIDADTLFDYRDAAASPPKSMPRADRSLMRAIETGLRERMLEAVRMEASDNPAWLIAIPDFLPALLGGPAAVRDLLAKARPKHGATGPQRPLLSREMPPPAQPGLNIWGKVEHGQFELLIRQDGLSLFDSLPTRTVVELARTATNSAPAQLAGMALRAVHPHPAFTSSAATIRWATEEPDAIRLFVDVPLIVLDRPPPAALCAIGIHADAPLQPVPWRVTPQQFARTVRRR